MAYRCATCGEIHDSVPDLAFQWPDPYFGVPEPERKERVRATSDVCAIDDEDFFMRGVILIPILGLSEQFGLGVWVSQKRENFQAYLDNFDTPAIGPFFGWLSSTQRIPGCGTWHCRRDRAPALRSAAVSSAAQLTV